MNHRERILAAIRHEPVDRVPTDMWATQEVKDALFAHFQVDNILDLYDRLGVDGIFGLCRNPTYVGLFAMNGGLWLIWPTAAVAAYFLFFFVIMEVQVRAEEEHLLKTHGHEYEQYLRRSARYFPGIY